MRRTVTAEQSFAQAMAGKRFDRAAPPAENTIRIPVPLPGLATDTVVPGLVEMGKADNGQAVRLDLQRLVDGRLLVQGMSGAGKSWALRRLLEQSAGMLQQLVIDPEGEFRTLADTFGLVYLDGHQLDAPAIGEVAKRAREHRLSVVLDLSHVEREDQMHACTVFCRTLIESPREQWHPALVVIDEAHLFAPIGGDVAGSVRKAATSALVDLMSRGRKRGLIGVLATQRMARLNKSVASEFQNFLIGGNTLDLDIRRAAETIGWDQRRAADRLPLLTSGHFVAVGPAFAAAHPLVVTISAVRSLHLGAAPQLAAPAVIEPADAAALLDVEQLATASRQRDEHTTTPGWQQVRKLLRDEHFPLLGEVIGALRSIVPDGATMASLAETLGATKEAIVAVVAILDTWRAVDVRDDAVRLQADMVPGHGACHGA